MNERIKELVVESGNGLMRDGKLYPHIGSRTEADWKKFAELIVKECADVAAKVGESYVKMGYTVPQECADKIKQHFGVEE